MTVRIWKVRGALCIDVQGPHNSTRSPMTDWLTDFILDNNRQTDGPPVSPARRKLKETKKNFFYSEINTLPFKPAISYHANTQLGFSKHIYSTPS